MRNDDDDDVPTVQRRSTILTAVTRSGVVYEDVNVDRDMSSDAEERGRRVREKRADGGLMLETGLGLGLLYPCEGSPPARRCRAL